MSRIDGDMVSQIIEPTAKSQSQKTQPTTKLFYNQVLVMEIEVDFSRGSITCQWAPKTRHRWARQNQPLEAMV